MTPTEVLRIVFERFRTGDRDGAVALFHKDATFTYNGPGVLHGTYVGHDAIQRFWASQDRFSGGFVPELLDLGESDLHAFLLVRIGEPPGPSFLRVVVYEVHDGLITAARVFEDDPEAAQQFFASNAP
ncbi:MAG: nuclear transport factor 2 family protein [Armatimonadota bacterium]|nr:nuclear transport factor 2 family protein [Armatimonadota bacterium]MDR7550676.1 nuclear transport factor 2 family protein [Armatimonadota bacterium]